MARNPHRFRLSRAGVLNVWQYDEQLFTFEDGRLLLRGTNGAGKSKTLEMLLPFVLDGDKARMMATGRHGSQLLWLMQEGSSGTGTRTGYLWVEFAREDERGERHVVTCGVGIRHSASAKTAATWAFTIPAGVPGLVEPDGTPLSAPRCRERVAELGGQSFDAPRAYKEHVGRLLFGLDAQRYDDLLQLLYWLRQPQVGEDIDPRRLVEMLAEALPALDEDAVRTVGESLDDLAEHGERLERLDRAATAVTAASEVYDRYAAGELRSRAGRALEAERDRSSRARKTAEEQRALESVTGELAAATTEQQDAVVALDTASAQVQVLESGPLARNQQVLREKQRRAQDLLAAAATAGRRAAEARERAGSSQARVTDETVRLAAASDALAGRAQAASASLLAYAVPGALAIADLAAGGAEVLVTTAAQARTEVSAAQAAVTILTLAVEQAAQALRVRAAAAERAAEAERREEEVAGRLHDVQREAAAADRDLRQAYLRWVEQAPGAAGAPSLPDELSVELLDALPEQTRELVAPLQAELRRSEAVAAALREQADSRLHELAERRAAVTAEQDPAPPGPALPRPARDPATGRPLWRLVDVRDSDGAGDFSPALLEAALEASGLLDAQVRADGALLAAGDEDTVLPPGPPTDGSSLADALVPDVPSDSPVGEPVVAAVLRRVALLDRVEGTGGPAAVGRDGSWRLGPLQGRASKPVAQYLGASARQAERARRLAEVEALTVAAATARKEADADERRAAQQREALESWLLGLPPSMALRRAWTRRDEREVELVRAQAAGRELAARAAAATSVAARAAAEVGRLAAQHRLPEQRDALVARGRELAVLDRGLERIGEDARSLLATARRLEEDRAGAERDATTAVAAEHDATAAQHAAVAAEQESQALLDTLGVEVQQLQAQLLGAQQRQRASRDRVARGAGQVLELTGRRGAAQARLQAALTRLQEAGPVVRMRTTALLDLVQVTGLLDAALRRPLQPHERTGLDGARGGDETPPRAAVELLRSWAGMEVARPVDANAVHAEVRTLAAGAAAESEPRVLPAGDAILVLARDDAGAELPLREVAVRLRAAVVRERELLTDRERTLFEEHLLGELGDKLRARRAEAADLVTGMNALLADVRTSQGIRVRLDWALRDDAGPDVRDAVDLLGRSRGSLLPDERARLRDALSALIEVQRSAEPERGYAEHLARALDYRRWSTFAVRITRPGATGWTALTRRTPLSQGEQKVVCYLPLFAAAAAHFTSVAGAAPYAPRLVLLDDAFPKIDVNTHPLLFGLLVDLDLDFVLTSERLWGDHATVPSLAIYEALRSPNERGIAQYRYVWDGRQLVTHGDG